MNPYRQQLHPPPSGEISIAKLALAGSVISLVGGVVVTASALIAYHNSLQQQASPQQPNTQAQLNYLMQHLIVNQSNTCQNTPFKNTSAPQYAQG